MIEVEGVCMTYRTGFMRRLKTVLSDLSFSVRDKAIVGYLGINGAGKTTTIKLIAGINSPDSGSIRVGGIDARTSESRALVGFLPENPYFYEYLSPREILDFFGKLHCLEPASRRKRAEELLERVKLSADADRPVREFSKGMRQRLGLAQALIHDPKVLVLDEPLTGLDPMGRLLLRELIVDERNNGRTVFFSSHVLSDVEAICDDLVIINNGKVAYQGPVDALLAQLGGGSSVTLRFKIEGQEELPEIEGLTWSRPLHKRAGAFEGSLESVDAAQEAIDKLRPLGAKVLLLRTDGLTLEEYFLAQFGKQEVAS